MLDMFNVMSSKLITHQVVCTNYGSGGYNDDGEYVEVIAKTFKAYVNLQPVGADSIQFLSNHGGTVDYKPAYTITMTDGNQVYPSRPEKAASDVVVNNEKFKVIYSENYPECNYCMAHLGLNIDAKR